MRRTLTGFAGSNVQSWISCKSFFLSLLPLSTEVDEGNICTTPLFFHGKNQINPLMLLLYPPVCSNVACWKIHYLIKKQWFSQLETSNQKGFPNLPCSIPKGTLLYTVALYSYSQLWNLWASPSKEITLAVYIRGRLVGWAHFLVESFVD